MGRMNSMEEVLNGWPKSKFTKFLVHSNSELNDDDIVIWYLQNIKGLARQKFSFEATLTYLEREGPSSLIDGILLEGIKKYYDECAERYIEKL